MPSQAAWVASSTLMPRSKMLVIMSVVGLPASEKVVTPCEVAVASTNAWMFLPGAEAVDPLRLKLRIGVGRRDATGVSEELLAFVADEVLDQVRGRSAIRSGRVGRIADRVQDGAALARRRVLREAGRCPS